jgi:hypothetical protein
MNRESLGLASGRKLPEARAWKGKLTPLVLRQIRTAADNDAIVKRREPMGR